MQAFVRFSGGKYFGESQTKKFIRNLIVGIEEKYDDLPPFNPFSCLSIAFRVSIIITIHYVSLKRCMKISSETDRHTHTHVFSSFETRRINMHKKSPQMNLIFFRICLIISVHSIRRDNVAMRRIFLSLSSKKYTFTRQQIYKCTHSQYNNNDYHSRILAVTCRWRENILLLLPWRFWGLRIWVGANRGYKRSFTRLYFAPVGKRNRSIDWQTHTHTTLIHRHNTTQCSTVYYSSLRLHYTDNHISSQGRRGILFAPCKYLFTYLVATYVYQTQGGIIKRSLLYHRI